LECTRPCIAVTRSTGAIARILIVSVIVPGALYRRYRPVDRLIDREGVTRDLDRVQLRRKERSIADIRDTSGLRRIKIQNLLPSECKLKFDLA
jgi:hypothetical protein